MFRMKMNIVKMIHKHKEEFPILFKNYKSEQKRLRKFVSQFVNDDLKVSRKIWGESAHLSKEGEDEYVAMVRKYMQLKKFPKDDRKVWITTHNGGKFVGFYANSKWWYKNVYDEILPVTSIVIKWENR